MTSKASDKPQPKGKEKRPWSKPQVRIMEMTFTSGGFNPNPNNIEGVTPGTSPTDSTYRTS